MFFRLSKFSLINSTCEIFDIVLMIIFIISIVFLNTVFFVKSAFFDNNFFVDRLMYGSVERKISSDITKQSSSAGIARQI